jgi:hypothetical protein
MVRDCGHKGLTFYCHLQTILALLSFVANNVLLVRGFSPELAFSLDVSDSEKNLGSILPWGNIFSWGALPEDEENYS